MDFRIYDKLPAPVRHWVSILGAVSQYWVESQAFVYAAALAFFTVFSIAIFSVL